MCNSMSRASPLPLHQEAEVFRSRRLHLEQGLQRPSQRRNQSKSRGSRMSPGGGPLGKDPQPLKVDSHGLETQADTRNHSSVQNQASNLQRFPLPRSRQSSKSHADGVLPSISTLGRWNELVSDEEGFICAEGHAPRDFTSCPLFSLSIPLCLLLSPCLRCSGDAFVPLPSAQAPSSSGTCGGDPRAPAVIA